MQAAPGNPDKRNDDTFRAQGRDRTHAEHFHPETEPRPGCYQRTAEVT